MSDVTRVLVPADVRDTKTFFLPGTSDNLGLFLLSSSCSVQPFLRCGCP